MSGPHWQIASSDEDGNICYRTVSDTDEDRVIDYAAGCLPSDDYTITVTDATDDSDEDYDSE